jgi:ribonuclease-3
LDTFQDQLGYRFKDLALLELALTHPSLAHERGNTVQHNQRLEFLGDAVLQLTLTDELFRKFPESGEGVLTKARARMVNRRTLADQSHRLSLGDYLVLSRGEELSGGRRRPSTLADAFEALLGAVFLDGGFDAARALVVRLFQEPFGALQKLPDIENPKGELQELLQADTPEGPEYRMESVSGPDHDRVFECAVFHRGVELGRGTGKSKKTAESEAAAAALARRRGAEGRGGEG